MCKCVVCPVPIQERCILALIGLRKAALDLLWGTLFLVIGSEIELILDAREIKASQLIAHQKVNYYKRTHRDVTLYPHSSLTGFSLERRDLVASCAFKPAA